MYLLIHLSIYLLSEPSSPNLNQTEGLKMSASVIVKPVKLDLKILKIGSILKDPGVIFGCPKRVG